MKLANRVLVVVLMLSLLGVVIPVSAQDNAVTLKFWTRAANERIANLLADTWNSTHDVQIDVNVIPDDQFVTRFGAAVAASEVPDLIAIDLIYAPAFSSQGQLLDITDQVQALPYVDDLAQAYMTLGTYEGRNYAVPFAAEGSFLMYNIDLFEQAGLDPENPPSNWDELLSAARTISALGDDTYGYYFAGSCPGCNAFTFLPLIWASDGDVLSEDFSEPTLDDPVVAEALDLYRTMWEEGLVPPEAEADNGANFATCMASGKVGMAGLGAFAFELYKSDYPDINFGITFLPGKDGEVASFGGGDIMAIPAGAQHPDEAWGFVEWLLSEETQLEIFAKNNVLPLRVDLAENEYFEADPRLITAAQTLGIGHTPYSVVYNDLFNDPNGPWLLMFQVAILDGDVAGAVEDAQADFAAIMER